MPVGWPLPPAVAPTRDLPPVATGTLTTYRLPSPAPYLPLWEWQREASAARAADRLGDLLLLLEHEHVYTLGRRGDPAHLLVDPAALARRGIACHRIDRGGDITYHGPGQLVGYPIVRLRAAGRGVRHYVGGLEAALIATAAQFGVRATTVPGRTGIWVGDAKLAAIGVAVGRGVAYHGFALNVATDLAYFEAIVPCGIPGAGATSLVALLGRPVTVEEVAPVCAHAIAAALDRELRWADAAVPGGDRPVGSRFSPALPRLPRRPCDSG